MDMKSLSEIATSIISRIHDTLSDIDTKEGTFVRDVFIDPTSSEMADLYTQMQLVELAQSVLTATGTDLDRLAGNFFITRKPAATASGKIRFYFGTDPLIYPVVVPQGTRVSTPRTAISDPLYFQTLETIQLQPGEVYSRNDGLYDEYYVDANAIASDSGDQYNVGATEINTLSSSLDSTIRHVSNPIAFTGGTVSESDASLTLRTSLAISGSNIGTKDGYRSFVLQQADVIDTMVVGAGDVEIDSMGQTTPLMTRDKGLGGCVDIYVLASTAKEYEQSTFNYTVDYKFLNPPDGKYVMSIPNQPVINVVSIKGQKPGAVLTDANGGFDYVYVNGSDYNIEKDSNRYYEDVLWTFTNATPKDSNNNDDVLLANAINTLNTQLSAALSGDRIAEINNSIRWSFIHPELDNVSPADPFFLRGYYNLQDGGDGAVYQLKPRDDAANYYISYDETKSPRFFIRKFDKIYQRKYITPDFILVKDTSDIGYSIKSTDYIQWIPRSASDNSNLPAEGETIQIMYNYNGLINSLQTNIETKRVLTADVLIKQAQIIPIEVRFDMTVDPTYVADDVKISVINRITSYINDVQQLGGQIDRTDIIYVARATAGVDEVRIDTLSLSPVGELPINRITLRGFQSMVLDSIYVRVVPTNSF